MEEDAQLEEALPVRLPATLLALEDTGLGDGDGEAGNYRVSREELDLRFKSIKPLFAKRFKLIIPLFRLPPAPCIILVPFFLKLAMDLCWMSSSVLLLAV